jgi:HK97 family phage prohead protease
LFYKVAENMQFQEVEYINKSQGISLDEFDNIKGIFGGYVAYYENKDRQGDIIKKGAFAEDIEKFYNKEKTISVFHEHNPYIVLSAEPLEIKDTNKGVYGLFQVANEAKEIHKSTWEKLPQLYKDGELGFSVGIQKAMTTPLEGGRFIIHKGIMKEFSTTKNPANLKARADIMKSMQEFDEILKGVSCFSRAEEFLRKNSNLSKTQCGDFLKKYESVVIEKSKNLNLEGGCQTKDFVGSQNKDAFTSELEKLFNQK